MQIVKTIEAKKEKLNQKVLQFVCKMQQDQSGLAGWEILLGVLVGVVLVGLLLKAASPTITDLWDSMVTKFKSLLTV